MLIIEAPNQLTGIALEDIDNSALQATFPVGRTDADFHDIVGEHAAHILPAQGNSIMIFNVDKSVSIIERPYRANESSRFR
jgi:hypothetical protein